MQFFFFFYSRFVGDLLQFIIQGNTDGSPFVFLYFALISMANLSAQRLICKRDIWVVPLEIQYCQVSPCSLMNFLFVLYDERQKEGTLLYYGASSRADFSVFLMSACQFLALFFFFLLQNIRWNLLGINLPKIQDVIFAVRQRPLPACFTWWTAILVVVSVNRLARTDCRSVSSAIWLHFWLQVSTRRRCVCSGRPCWLAPVCRRQC